MTAPLTHFGRYRVIAELGRGAMGVVYRADDAALDRQVAVKTILLPQDPAERATYEARFLQEAKAAGSLNHPNIITIYDLGREGDWAFIAMELLDGEELRDLMNAGRVPLDLALLIGAQVARALAAAHARNIVHRDIKPSNIMVQRGEHAKIMDFGIARMQESDVKTQTGMILGSPKYMSPEQVNGEPLDARSDLFSLAVILYEMVTGTGPFTGKDLAQLMFNITHADPVAPSQINHAIPKMLDLVIHKGLQKDLTLRYQDGMEMAADLEACLIELGPAHGADLTAPGKPEAASAIAARATGSPATVPLPARAADGYATTMIDISAAADGLATTVKTPQAGAGVADDKTQRLPAGDKTQRLPAGDKAQRLPAAAGTTPGTTPSADVTRMAARTPATASPSPSSPSPASPSPSMERRAHRSGTRLSLAHQFDSAQALTALDDLAGHAATQAGAARAGPRDVRRWIWPAAYALALTSAVIIVFV